MNESAFRQIHLALLVGTSSTMKLFELLETILHCTADQDQIFIAIEASKQLGAKIVDRTDVLPGYESNERLVITRDDARVRVSLIDSEHQSHALAEAVVSNSM
jgi:hypothetical protein